MKDNTEDRMALGKQADDHGLILTVVGDEYRLHGAAADPERPEFSSSSLSEVKSYLDQRDVNGTGD